jgi:Calx-beta domain/Right handed beta helix region/IPT/TIG domain
MPQHPLRGVVLATLIVCSLSARAATYVVTNNNDSGPGSLREAIAASYAAGGRIEFSIGSGPKTIQLLTRLPELSSTVIDGTTQPGYAGTPIIELDGSLIGPEGVGLIAYSSTVDSLVINGFSNTGVLSTNSTVRNCYIGTDITGSSGKPNDYGISGWGHFEGNLISGNRIGMLTYLQSTVVNNRFGTNASGNAVLNIRAGLHILGSPGLIENNVIGGSQGIGILVRYSDQGTTIRDNFIGVSRTGVPLPNSTGIYIEEAAGAPVTGNHIAYNEYVGIEIYHKTLRILILNNRIEKNGMGIKLEGNGGNYFQPTPNDPGDADVGANNLQNYPVITEVTAIGNASTITGTLDSAPNRGFTIELYLNDACDPFGHGQGAARLEWFDITTDAAGHASFTRTYPTALPLGRYVAATATSSIEGTSEFSACRVVDGTGAFAFSSASASIAEASRAGTLTITRTPGAVGAATAYYRSADGTASAGSDYAALNGMISFAQGETSKTIPISATNDGVYEGPQTFTVTIWEAAGASVGSPSTATVTIVDAQSPPAIAAPPVALLEGDSGQTSFDFVLTMTGTAEMPMTVNYTTAAGTAAAPSDFVAASGQVTFAPGDATKTVTVHVVGDHTWEQDETFRLLWTYAGPGGEANGTIRNDDAPATLTADHVAVRETDGSIFATITLQTSEPVTGSVLFETIAGSALAGQDYAARTGSVSFANESMKTLAIEIKGDDATEPVESFVVNLQPAWGGLTIAAPNVAVEITDDDIGVGPQSLRVPAGQSRSVAIKVGPATTDTTIQLVSSDPAGFSVPASIALPAGETNASFDVNALIAGRTGTVLVTFPPALGGMTAEVHVTTYIGAELRLSPASVNLFAGQIATIHASLVPPQTQPVAVRLTPSNANTRTANDFVVPAGGEGTFTIDARQQGLFTVTATLPAEYGSETFIVRGRISPAAVKPALTRVSPSDGSVAGGTEVEIHGALLRADCTVTFGGVAANVRFVSAQLLNATTPPHAAGNVDVALACGDDRDELPRAFLYRSASMSLSSIAPSAGSISGGTFVRITGADIVHSCWPVFGGVRAPEARVHNPNTITAVAPPHAAGTVDVSLLCTGGNALLANAFTFHASSDPAAQIQEIEPLFGAPGEAIAIRGTHFRLDDVVMFGSVAATILESTPESHVVVVPDVAAGETAIAIDGAANGLTSTSGALFTVGEAAPPRVTAVAPGSAMAGAEVELEGTMLRAPYTFAFGGRQAQIVTLTPSRAVVRLPLDLAVGDYRATVLNGNGQIASLGASLHVTADGVLISQVSRRCGTTEGGVDVIVRGKGFSSGASVKFDSVPASAVTFIDAMTIQARVPPNAAGPATIEVTNPDGRGATRTHAFRYSSPFDPSPDCSEGRGRAVRH